jgi:hypothetical protein
MKLLADPKKPRTPRKLVGRQEITLAILKSSWRSFPKDAKTVCELGGSKNNTQGKDHPVILD